jgi:hypothetical protein
MDILLRAGVMVSIKQRPERDFNATPARCAVPDETCRFSAKYASEWIFRGPRMDFISISDYTFRKPFDDPIERRNIPTSAMIPSCSRKSFYPPR